MRARPISLFIAASVLLVACAEEDDSADGTEAPEYRSDEELLEEASNYWDNTTRVNVDPELSDHENQPYVNIFVSEIGESEFRSLDPQVSNPDITFPEGTFLVKEHKAEPDGEVMSYALMYKQAEGYNPDAGDWWWAITDTEFNVMMDLVGNGSEVTFCGECHSAPAEFASSDFAIGVDSANQT